MTAALLLALASHDDSAEVRASRLPIEPADALPETEHEIVRQLRANDMQAFDTLFDRFWGPLWRFATAECRNDALAEDVVQEIFARLWARRATWNPGTSIQAYLFRAVRNELINRRKHDRVVRLHMGRAMSEARDVVHESNSDRAVRLDVALQRLSDDQRLTLTLRYEHAMRYAEVGEVLGISAVAAEKRVLRALDALRAWMAG